MNVRESLPFSPSQATQQRLLGLAILATACAAIAAILISLNSVVDALRHGLWFATFASIFGGCIAAALFYGNLAHQIASLGHLRMRGRQESRTAGQDRTAVDDFDKATAPSLTVLVPSYKENLHIVRQTLLSVALQECPNRRIVLLIDDPPFPNQREDMQALVDGRRLPRQLQSLLDRAASRFQLALESFVKRKAAGNIDLAEETGCVARLYRNASTWFLEQAAAAEVADHFDAMFVEAVLLRRARMHADHAAQLGSRAKGSKPPLSEDELLREYRRLAALFRVELTCFERKRFVNLSHEPNKAMNLNSYLGLIGNSYRVVNQDDGIALRQVAGTDADLTIADAKYVIVVDADSLLLPDYGPQLLRALEQPGNERLAVAQSPYLSVPNPPGLLERTAAATVAGQYVVHLGFAEYDAVYWVGANAVIRKQALDEICMPIVERGHTMLKYIQDRTHIEDTESTIDLVQRGWRLYNAPQPLAYSATPADFGSLLIQRRRWANGGLIVLPRLAAYLVGGRRVPQRWLQGFLRIGYLLNLSLGSLAVLLTFLVPLPLGLIPCLAVAGICYALVYGADIVRMGFRPRDLLHVYALNLMLTSVNLGGAAKSIHQAWTGKKTPFARTPKTKGRTWIPPLYVGAQYGMLAFCLVVGTISMMQGRVGQAIWAFANSIAFLHVVGRLLWDEAPENVPQPGGVGVSTRLTERPSDPVGEAVVRPCTAVGI